MPIVSIEIMKTINEREMQENNNNKKQNKQRQKGEKGTKAIGKAWGLNDFVVHLT